MDGELVKQVGQAIFAAPEERLRMALRALNGEYDLQTPRQNIEPFVTLKAVSKAVGISTCSLWRYKIPSRSLGGRPKFLISEVRSYLDSPEFRAHARRLRKERALKGGAPCKQ